MAKYPQTLCCLLLIFGGAQAFTAGRATVSFNVRSSVVKTSALSFNKPTSRRAYSESAHALASSSAGNDEEYSPSLSNIPFAVVWAALLGFTFFIAPGEAQSTYDNNIIQAIIENPQNPDVNELFVFIFNLFAVIPLALACVALPQSSKNGPPPAPFLIVASFLGYFILGPYMALRGSPKEETSLDDLGWITANVLENKIVNTGALALAAFFVTQVSWGDFSSLAQGYADMASMSKLVSVSSVDLCILTGTAAALIPQDYRLRNPEDAARANLIGASTLLLPVFGSLIYCVLRPKLPQD
jgi:hypothetical protein